MAIAQRFITAERFFELVDLPEYLDCNLELVEGHLVEMSKPKRRHGVITMRLARIIADHVEANELGEVPASETGFVLARNPHGKDTVRGLDIAFVSKAKLPATLDDDWYEAGPDLAVEVISPSNKAGDIQLKVKQLLNAGTRLVWVVYAEDRSVMQFTAAGGFAIFSEHDTLVGGDVLPGFQIRVRDIFPY